MRHGRFILAVLAVATAWLAEGLAGRLAGLIPGKNRDGQFTDWGNALKKPAGDEAPARTWAKRFARVPGFATGGRGAAGIFAEHGRGDRLP